MQTLTELPKASWTYPAVVRRQAETYGDRVFCTFEDGRTLSFRELDVESSRLASGLAQLGLLPGDRAVVLAFNTREFVVTMIAVHKLGAIFVPINTELKGAFLEHQLRVTQPRVLFVDAALRQAFETVELAGID